MTYVPDSYLVFDLETNGFVPQEDLYAVQYGYCLVQDRDVVQTGAIILNIPQNAKLEQGAVDVHGISRHRMDTEGVCPKMATELMHSLLQRVKDANASIVAHNIKYDVNGIERMFERYGLEPMNIPAYSRVFDTGVVYKASKLMKTDRWCNDAKRRPGEAMWNYIARVGGIRAKGVKWNVDTAIEELKIPLEKRAAHDAGEDCYYTHRILETLREQEWVPQLLGGAA
jgi:DNA polymerase III epsilon subunit-like protein